MFAVHQTAVPATLARASAGRKIAIACLLALGCSNAAWATPILGAAQSFTVLGGSTVTNTGLTTVNGDVGVAPGTALTGFGSATLLGTLHSDDAAATLAHGDALAANNYLASLAFTRDLSGLDLGGMTLGAGIYRIASSAQLTGTLVLDAQNMANALFVFQIGTTLTTATAAAVNVINGSADTGVFFGVGTSAVLGAGSMFAGNIIANDSITLSAAASLLCGRALALNGAVTLDTNRVSNDCSAGGALGTTSLDYGSEGFAGIAAGQDLPEPASALLLPLGLAALAYGRRRRGA
ncbi:ice-binding family protein [Massilia sp. S19_KUP03_FR1]|uniref:ice-binding family protein n=1 Tax=Massilia sp. S19_KUP03_FR1 TaxID=3025503 RepID=UPI002FCDA42B